MYQQITIKTLSAQGKSPGQIAQLVGCHRNTVRQVLRREIKEFQTRDKPSSLTPHHDLITNLLDQQLSLVRIFQKLKDEHQIALVYSTLVKYVRNHVKKSSSSFIVQQVAPGEEAEIDFGYGGLIAGKRVWFLVVTLSHSRLAYYGALPNQTVGAVISGLVDAFEYFGGVPKSLKIDNFKAAVLTNRRFELEFNRTFLNFSLHYQFVIKPCTPRTPRQKGKVESGVKYVKGNFLAGRTFVSVGDLESQLHSWMINTANQRIHGTTKQVPQVVFSTIEQSYLQPLPTQSFSYAPPLKRVVSKNCHVQYENAYYSVPYRYVGQNVEIRTQGNLVLIVQSDRVIATHSLSPSAGNYVTNTDHYPEGRIYSQTRYQARYEQKMKLIGTHAQGWFVKLVKRNPLWTMVVKKVLGYVSVYGADSVNQACRRALAYDAFTPGVIGRILKHGLYKLELEPKLLDQITRPAATMPTHTPISKTPLIHLQNDFSESMAQSPSLVRPLSYYQNRNQD